ncbi:glycoside hydrolase family 3 protein [Microlunatus sp. Gsoil 973]|uniref:glycoside hydrolase family 3 protein n=1 Tax=Microlunatus sp. Gsoil 973 TaxID=2672569 RepID=UPI0012B4F2A1|nr:glycoside hydrolase family 3 protein [Microlunatus sp. Gsoil 973]QGN33453.1 glycoside hydrolase family 3 protein [Microlunatus sp. Gsoil 973]
MIDPLPVLATMNLEQKIGQLIIQLVYGAADDEPDKRNTELFGVPTPAEVVRKYHLGGVVYFAWAGNTADPRQIGRLSNGLQAAAKAAGLPPLIIGTDQETGRVVRMGPPATQFPGAMALAAAHSADAVRQAYAITGRELRAVGINADFAPVADVNVNQANPVIGVRSFSSEPDVVADQVAAAVAGLQLDAGISAAAKHFPGHGDTATDSHHGLPVITHSMIDWEALDAPPFRAAVRSGVDMIMTGHLALPDCDPSGDPATLSRPVLTGLLREDLDFSGVIITDSLRMDAVRESYGDGEVAVRALEAGVDILLEPADPDAAVSAIREAIQTGRLTEQRIDASVRRILELKQRRGLFDVAPTDAAEIDRLVGSVENRDRAAAITDSTVTLVRDDQELVPLPNRPTLVVGADGSVVGRISRGLRSAGLRTTESVTGPDPSRELIDRARRQARSAFQTVVVMSAGWRSQRQRMLSRAIREAASRVVLVAVTEPYDAGMVADGGTMLLTYSATPGSVDALVRVLLGRVPPTGRLPLAVGEIPDRPLFPYGAGVVR